jgi:hypothetical protein
VLLALLVSEPVALLLDVSVLEPVPETEPDAEPEMEPEPLTLAVSDDVALDVEDWLDCVDEALAAGVSAVDVSLIVLLLLCVSREQPGPNTSAADINAAAPNKLRFFFMVSLP